MFHKTVLALAIFGASLAPAQQPIQGVGAKLVHVPAVVHDKKGALILTLKKEDFDLKVDGKPQQIRYFTNDANLPLTLGLLVDVSGSVANRLDDERRASSAFLDDMLTSDADRAFVIQFGHKADLLADLTNQRGKLQEGLKQLEGDRMGQGGGRGRDDNNRDDRNGPPPPPDDDRNSSQQFFQYPGMGGGQGRRGGGQRPDGGQGRGPGGFGGGGTVLYDATFLASDELMKKQKGRKAIILLTDGEDRGSKVSLVRALEAAQRADTIVYAIYYKGEEGGGQRGFGSGPRGGWPGPGGGGNRGGDGDGKKVLLRMTQETGGQMFEVSKKHPVDEIYKEIARELRSQYRIEFTPDEGTGSDGYHQIDLQVKDKKLFVQTRDGYYVGEPSR